MKAIILAAGKSSRMHSTKHKALHKVCGETVLFWLLRALSKTQIEEVVMVVGHQSDQIKEEANLTFKRLSTENNTIPKLIYARDDKQIGTANALKQALLTIDDEYNRGIYIMCVDTPLINSETLHSMHDQTSQMTILAGQLKTVEDRLSAPLGRLITKEDGQLSEIKEYADCTPEERSQYDLYNSGVYYIGSSISVSDLKRYLNQIDNRNTKGEYYLTDLIGLLYNSGLKVAAHIVSDQRQLHGINTRIDLAQAERYMSQIAIEHMPHVTWQDMSTCTVSPLVNIDRDTIVGGQVTLLGQSQIGERCYIGPNSHLQDTTLADDVNIRMSHIYDSKIGPRSRIGPYAHIRQSAMIGEDCLIGNYVELKNTTINNHSAASHLSYLGDSLIGERVNIGAGTITANYNAITGDKTQCILGNDVKTGSNSVIIAPNQIESGCMIAAGTVVTDNVQEPDSLVIGRARQEIKTGWVKKQKDQLSEQ